jgi:hypothetical protein
MKEKRVTIDQVMAWSPCYTKEKITELFGKRKTLSAMNILDLDIPAKDRVWAALHDDLFEQKDLILLACEFARSTLHIFEDKYPDDKRPRLAIEMAEKVVSGEATEEQAAWAAEAAGAAARAAEEAAGAAAEAAARAAAEAAWAAMAAWEAARAAAEAAAGAAARAARAAEQEKQVEIIRTYIEQVRGGK